MRNDLQIELRRLAFSTLFCVSVAASPVDASRAADSLEASGSAISPTYRILPRPLHSHHGKHVPYSTTHQPTAQPNYESRATSPYAYGWFGPRPSPHWSRHFGTQQRYTQWSLK